jgi:hypothetical protein
VIDGAKALRKAADEALGAKAAVQRCRRHYADFPVMPTCEREALSGAVIAAVGRHNQSASRKASMVSGGR